MKKSEDIDTRMICVCWYALRLWIDLRLAEEDADPSLSPYTTFIRADVATCMALGALPDEVAR